jgi:CubicO group peptidase (beta-lactamase class C family)
MNLRVRRALMAAGILISGAIAAAHGQTVDQFAAVRAAMRRFVDSGDAPSVAVSVARDGRIVWEEAIGWANRERAIRATPNTMYPLASISKSLTATAVMVLVERGTIDLDAPTNRYLGSSRLTGLAGNSDSATIRRVLSHTAGLPLHSQIYYADRGYAPPSMEETIRRYGILV